MAAGTCNENCDAGLSEFVPKGLKDSAWGFNPRYRFKKITALKGRKTRALRAWRLTKRIVSRARISLALSGRTKFFGIFLGLKPQAKSLSPFETKSPPPTVTGASRLLHQKHRPSAFDLARNLAVQIGWHAGYPARQDLSAFCNEFAK